MLSMVAYAHQRVETYGHVDIAVDFTMGRGTDTLFLTKWAREVYAFDIQEEALKITAAKIKDQEHVHLILDSHENFDQYVSAFDLGIFNLGYLPQSDQTITTTVAVTLKAVQKAVAAMRKALWIVVYVGHEEGQRESDALLAYLSALDHQLYNVSSYQMLNKEQAPYVIEIEKRA